MSALRSRLRMVRSDERGVTLTELLVVIMMLAVVCTATLGLLDAGAKLAPRENERTHAIQEAQQGLNRMVRELRQAYRIIGWTSDSIRIEVRVLRDNPATTGVEEHVNLTVDYSCGSENPGKCVRREAPVGSPLPAAGETVIARVQNWEPGLPVTRRVFNFDTSSDRTNPLYAAPITPSYVTVRVEVPAAGERTAGTGGYENSVVLDDGLFIRNVAPQ